MVVFALCLNTASESASRKTQLRPLVLREPDNNCALRELPAAACFVMIYMKISAIVCPVKIV